MKLRDKGSERAFREGKRNTHLQVRLEEAQRQVSDLIRLGEELADTSPPSFVEMIEITSRMRSWAADAKGVLEQISGTDELARQFSRIRTSIMPADAGAGPKYEQLIDLTRQRVEILRAILTNLNRLAADKNLSRSVRDPYPTQARQSAAEALKLASTSQGVESEAALAFATAGDAARAESLAQDVSKRSPLCTQIQSLWLPTIHAQLELDRKNPTLALSILRAASPIELGQIGFSNNISCLYSVYVRGEAYLAAGQGSAAAAEFQKILDHSGIVWNCWTGALAHLGVARANALQS